MGNKIFSKNIFICRNTKNPRETYKHKVSRGVCIYISAINSISSTNNRNHFSYKSVAKKNIFFLLQHLYSHHFV